MRDIVKIIVVLLIVLALMLFGLMILDNNKDNSKDNKDSDIVSNLNSNIDEERKSEIPQDFIAVFHGGSGELTHETYIYKIDNGHANMGFKYINTETYGMSADTIKQKILKKGEVTWTDNVFGVAKENDAYSFVTLPNDNKTYTIEEFQSMFLMN